LSEPDRWSYDPAYGPLEDISFRMQGMDRHVPRHVRYPGASVRVALFRCWQATVIWNLVSFNDAGSPPKWVRLYPVTTSSGNQINPTGLCNSCHNFFQVRDRPVFGKRNNIGF